LRPTTTSRISGENGRIAVTVPARFAGTGTSSKMISASPSIVAWQASTVPPSSVPWSSTLPETTRTLQVSHCPEQQSCGMSIFEASPASTKVSPMLARSRRPFTVSVHLLLMINLLSLL
jgi:hypothetical protein